MYRTFRIVLFFICINHSFDVAGRSFEFSTEWAMGEFDFIENAKRFIEEIDLSNHADFPVGMRKIVANVPATLAISNIRLGADYAEATFFLKLEIPQHSQIIIFGAENVKISYTGDLIGEVKLALMSDVTIPLGKTGNLILKGAIDKESGSGKSDTYVALDCNADFKRLSIDAGLELNKDVFISAATGKDRGKPVAASFKMVVEDWNQLLFEVSFPPFELKSLEGFIFEIKKATLDLNDVANATGFTAPKNYFKDYCSLPDKNLWRGVFIKDFTLTLPPEFKIRDTSERIQLEGTNMLIDENGLTGGLAAKDILPLEKGDANGWRFSVTDFEFALTANNITAFGFGGEIGIPVSNKQKTWRYSVLIDQGGKYLFKVALDEKMNIDLFGAAEVHLDRTSYMQVVVENKTFKPSLVLNGSMSLNTAKAFHLEKFTFKKLTFSSEAPYLSVEKFDCEGDLKFQNFPVSIENISLMATKKDAALTFDFKLNLMKDRISAQSKVDILAEYKDNHWEYKGFQLEKVILDRIALPGFTLTGHIDLKEDDPVYGDYLGGELDAQFDALSDALKVRVAAQFGCKDDFRYWFVEGDAEFPGIPIGPVSINGFSGGAYYKMRAKTNASGQTKYLPDSKNSLGVRAGISFAVGNKKAVNGDALFEMTFLTGGGIDRIRLYGHADFLGTLEKSAKVKELYSQAAQQFNDMSGSLAAKLPKNLSGSEIAEMVFPQKKKKDGIAAYLTMEYDCTSRTFDAQFRTTLNIAGGVIRGAGTGDVAGWAHIHASPDTWFVHVGTPTNPIAIQVGFNSLSLSAKAYLMAGDQIPASPPPPSIVTDILKITPGEADYMKHLNEIGQGRGFAFGSSLSFDTGNMNFLLLYARFAAGIGYDVMLKDYSDYYCEGKNDPIGINGWYANGQCYAYFLGELGVNIKIFGVKRKIPVIRGATAALLQAKLPNPTWFGGYLAVEMNVLGGLIRGHMRMKMDLGDDCKLVRADGEYSPVDMPMIGDLSPGDKSEGVDVFTSPQAAFNMAVGIPFVLEDEEGTKTYRILLDEFYVTDAGNNRIEGKINWNAGKNEATFFSKEILPPNSKLTAFVSVKFEQNEGGQWTVVRQSGKDAKETKTVHFRTGTAPDYIPLTNIDYCYPVVNQSNFYRKESERGYVQLKKGQKYLFPEGFDYKVDLKYANGQANRSPFVYDVSAARINYQNTGVHLNEKHELSFVALPVEPEKGDEAKETISQSFESGDESGNVYVLDIKQQTARKIVREGHLELLKYTFKSAKHETFKDKIVGMQLAGTLRYENSDVRSLVLKTANRYELLDESELVGTNYTAHKPLIEVEAVLTDAYYREKIAPLLYNWYPGSGIFIENRVETELGVPPVKAFTLYENYLSSVSSGTFNSTVQQVLPYVYVLPLIYQQDYLELKNKVVNSRLHSGTLNQWMFLIDSHFPFMPQGKYKAKYQYVLPGGENGSAMEVEYYNPVGVGK